MPFARWSNSELFVCKFSKEICVLKIWESCPLCGKSIFVVCHKCYGRCMHSRKALFGLSNSWKRPFLQQICIAENCCAFSKITKLILVRFNGHQTGAVRMEFAINWQRCGKLLFKLKIINHTVCMRLNNWKNFQFQTRQVHSNFQINIINDHLKSIYAFSLWLYAARHVQQFAAGQIASVSTVLLWLGDSTMKQLWYCDFISTI